MASVSFYSAPLTADGGSNGIVSVASTATLVKGAYVFLSATGLTTVELEVAEILSGTQVALKLQSSPSARYNCSAFTTALAATLTQPNQDVFAPLSRHNTGRAVIVSGESGVVVLYGGSTPDTNVQAWLQGAEADDTLTFISRTFPEYGKFTIFGNATATNAVNVAWEIS